LHLIFCTLKAMVGVSSISSVLSRARPLMDTSSLEREVLDSNLAVSPNKMDPIEVTISLRGASWCPAPGSLVNNILMVTVMSKSRVPIGFMVNQSASLVGSM